MKRKLWNTIELQTYDARENTTREVLEFAVRDLREKPGPITRKALIRTLARARADLPDDELEPFVPEDRVSEGSEDECCPTTFIYAPDRPEQVASAVLRGSLYPLNDQDGLTLEESEGFWSGEACLTPDEYGTYHYDVELRTGGEETFPTVAHNPYAPTTTTAAGDIVNEWQPADDCASLDVSVHAKISE